MLLCDFSFVYWLFYLMMTAKDYNHFPGTPKIRNGTSKQSTRTILSNQERDISYCR